MILAFTTLALAGPEPAASLWDVLGVLGEDTASTVERVDHIRDLAVAMTSKVEASKADLALLRALREDIMELDLRGLYEAFPEAVGSDGRRLSVRGVWNEPVYTLDIGASGPEPQGIGALNVGVSLAPTEVSVSTVGEPWRIAGNATSELGALDAHAVSSLWEEGFSRVEALATAGVAVESALQPQLTADSDRRLWGVLEGAAPTFAGRLSDAVVVDRIGTVTSDGLAFDAHLHLDTTALRNAKYPALARYLRRLGRVFVGRIRVIDTEGGELARLSANSSDLSFGMAMLIHRGAVIPRRAGEAVHGSAVRPSDPEIRLQVVLDMTMRSDGMQLDITDYAVPTRWHAGQWGSELDVRITSVPDLRVQGSSGWTNWMAAMADGLFDLEGHAMEVFAAVAHGADGTGTHLQLLHDQRGSVNAMLSGLLVDNGMVRFFMRLVGRHVVPSDAAVAEAYGAAAALVRALDADWRTIRRSWLVNGIGHLGVDGEPEGVVGTTRQRGDFDE